MKRFILVFLMMFVCSPVFAAPHLHENISGTYGSLTNPVAVKKSQKSKINMNYTRKERVASSHGWGPYKGKIGGKPGRWCGYFMRSHFGGGPEYNLARNWAKRGSNAGGPQVGAVVVWRHHVGLITGKAANGRWIVLNGNYRNRVAEVPMSLKGAIAFRMM